MKLCDYISESKARIIKVYRGTPHEITDVNQFGQYGVYFTEEMNQAIEFADEDGFLIEAKIRVSNPYIAKDDDEMTRQAEIPSFINELKRKGYDSVTIYDSAYEGYWVVFDKSQIKIISCLPVSEYRKMGLGR